MTTGRILAAMLVMLAAPSSVEAATLHPSVILHGPAVKLSDLFAGLQPGQDCEIGPAPGPGRRLIVPPSQIAAIASQFGVDLQDAGSNRGATIERPARTIRRDEIVASLKPALIAAGMPADSAISLGVFAAPLLAADETGSPSVVDMDYEPQTGRFSASLQFAGSDAGIQSMRVTGRSDEMLQALVLLHDVPAGSPITASDVEPAQVPKSRSHGVQVTDIGQVSGLVARQNMAPGTALTQDQLWRPLLVTRGRPVVLRLVSGGLALTAAGTALEAGGDGDRIHVMNSSTHAVLLGAVAGGSEVLIDPGTAPVFVAQAGGGGLPRLVADAAAGSLPQIANPAQEAH